jgi:hypothetical protein
MFPKYLAKMDLILMLSKFSGQIGPKPKRLTGLAVLMESALTGRLEIGELFGNI